MKVVKALVVFVVAVLLLGGLFFLGGPALEKAGGSLGLLSGFLLVALVFWLPIVAVVCSGASDYS